jgi:hypothetical protein
VRQSPPPEPDVILAKDTTGGTVAIDPAAREAEGPAVG